MTEETYELNDDTWNMIYRRASLPDSPKPCDKTSHGCHIECDTVSHDEDRSCWTCMHYGFDQDIYESTVMYCFHPDIDSAVQLPLTDCKSWENCNG